MHDKDLLNASSILVSSGSPSGVVIATGTRIYVPTLDEIPDILHQISVLKGQGRLLLTHHDTGKSFLIFMSTEADKEKLLTLVNFLSPSLCDDCDVVMQVKGDKLICPLCGKHQ